MAKLIQYVLKIGVAMLFGFLFAEANAQQPCRIIIYPVDTDSAAMASLQLQNIFPNKASCIQYTDRLPQLLAMKGYAAASVDSAYDDSTSVSIRLFVGDKFTWEKLSVNDSAYSLLNKLGYYQQQFDHQRADHYRSARRDTGGRVERLR